MIEQPPLRLVRGIDHRSVEAVLGEDRQEFEIRREIREQDGNQFRPRGKRRERRRTRRDISRRKEADLHEVHAGRGNLLGLGPYGFGLHRQVAADRAGGAASGDQRHGLTDGVRGDRAERAGLRILQVDDVDAAGNRDLRLRDTGDAGQHFGHFFRVSSLADRTLR